MTKSPRQWILYDSLHRLQSNPVSTENVQLAILKMTEQDTVRFFIWTAGWEKWQPLKAYLESNQNFFVSSLSAFSTKKGIEDHVRNSKEQKSPLRLNEETIAEIKDDFKTVKAKISDVLNLRPAEKHIEDEVTKSSFYILSPGAETVTSGPSKTTDSGTGATGSSSKVFSTISLEEKDIFPSEDQAKKANPFDGDDLTLSSNPDEAKKPKIDFKTINNTNLRNRSDRHELKIEILLISSKGKTFRSRSRNISLSGSLLEDSIPFDYCERIFDVVVINKQPCDPQFQRVSLMAKTVGEGLTQRIHFVNMTAKSKQDLQNLLENYLKIQSQLKKTS